MKKFNSKIESRLSGRHFACAEAIDYTNKKILNIGCGIGFFEYLTKEKAKEIVGIDLSYKDINLAKKEFKSLKNINFIRTDITKQNLLEEVCDVVTMFDIIEHLPKGSEQEVINKLYKTIKQEGKIIISTPKDNFSKYFDIAWLLWWRRHRHYSSEQIAEFLVNAGFEVERIYISGGIFEMLSMIFFYPFKWLFNLEIPFKGWFDKKRNQEYRKDKGFITLFVIAKKKKKEI